MAVKKSAPKKKVFKKTPVKKTAASAAKPKIVKAETPAPAQQSTGKVSVFDVPPLQTLGYPFSGTNRSKYAAVIDFDSLRTFSVMYDVARACINHRKRQISNLDWAVIPKDPKADPEKYRATIDALTAFFEKPTHGMEFKTFLDRMLEDLLVLDAVVLWKDRTYGGQLKDRKSVV